MIINALISFPLLCFNSLDFQAFCILIWLFWTGNRNAKDIFLKNPMHNNAINARTAHFALRWARAQVICCVTLVLAQKSVRILPVDRAPHLWKKSHQNYDSWQRWALIFCTKKFGLVNHWTYIVSVARGIISSHLQYEYWDRGQGIHQC